MEGVCCIFFLQTETGQEVRLSLVGWEIGIREGGGGVQLASQPASRPASQPAIQPASNLKPET